MKLGDNDAGFQPEPYPDSRHWKEQNQPTLTTVVTSLPEQWGDYKLEPMKSVGGPQAVGPVSLFEQQKGEVWFVKLPGAVSLVEMEILDITLKTVLVQTSRRYGQSTRYARTDIEFVERVDA